MRQGVKKIFKECIGKDVRTIEELHDGFSNENYLVNDAYVLRLPRNDGDPTISRIAEHKAYQIIEPLKICEKVAYFDEKTGVKITKYVHNPIFYTSTPTNEQILQVARSIKKLHRSGLKIPFDYNAIKKMKTYKKSLPQEELLPADAEKYIINEYKKNYISDDVVLCHNDLVKGNLLFKFNGLTIIDWEYSSMNSFYFDLASFISENELNEEQEIFFLKKYFGYKYSGRKKKTVEAFMHMQDVLFYYWALFLDKKRGNPIYRLIANIKYDRILETMKQLER